MILTDEQIKLLIKQPRNAELLREARQHELLLNILATGQNSQVLINSYCEDYVDELRPLLQKHFAIHSVPFLSPDSGTVYSHFAKINTTREGKSISYNFENVDEFIDAVFYLGSCYCSTPGQRDGISNTDFFKHTAIADVLYRPNTRLIVDFPSEADTMQGSMPTVQRVDVCQIHDIVERKHGIEYLIVRKEFGRRNHRHDYVEITDDSIQYTDRKFVFYIYDDEKYQLWEQKGASALKKVSEFFHDFGVCPARSVSGYQKSTRSIELKKSPISDSLPDIKNWNQWKNCVEFHKKQKGIPPSVGISQICDYEHPESGSKCTGGYYHLEDNSSGTTRYILVACPACERKKKEKMNFARQLDIKYEHIFQGQNVEVKALQVLKESLGFIEVDIKFLKYAEEALETAKQRIVDDIIGRAFNRSESKEGFNQDQIATDTDDRANNLSTFSLKLEALQEWADSMVCKSRYLTFVSMSAWYGRGYFLKSTLEYQNEVNLLIEKTGDAFLISQKLDELAASQCRYDSELLKFSQFINAIIPFRDVPIAVLLQQADSLNKNETTSIQFSLRLNAVNLIKEFLLFHKNTIFARQVSEKTKFKNVKKWFYKRAKELIKNTNINKVNDVKETY